MTLETNCVYNLIRNIPGVVLVVVEVEVVVVIVAVVSAAALAMGLAHNASRGVEVQEMSCHFPSPARICTQSWPPSALLG